MTTALPDRGTLVASLLDQIGVEDAGLRELLATRLGGSASSNNAISPRERQLVTALKRSERVNAAMVAKIEMLACALGACPTCWGNEEACKDCGGDGHPGSMVPDPQCFERFVAPLLDQLEDHSGTGASAPSPRPRRAKLRPLPDAIDITPTKENGS